MLQCRSSVIDPRAPINPRRPQLYLRQLRLVPVPFECPDRRCCLSYQPLLPEKVLPSRWAVVSSATRDFLGAKWSDIGDIGEGQSLRRCLLRHLARGLPRRWINNCCSQKDRTTAGRN